MGLQIYLKYTHDNAAFYFNCLKLLNNLETRLQDWNIEFLLTYPQFP